MYNLIKLRFKLRKYTRNHETIASLFKKIVDRHPEKIAFRIEDKIWTFRQVDEHSNAVAHYFQKAGYQPGDTIALFMESRPEYVCIWLGLSKIGVITALINFNLREKPLLHCIAAAKPRSIIFGGELTEGKNCPPPYFFLLLTNLILNKFLTLLALWVITYFI